MYEKFGQFIDGKWQQSSDNGTYEVINPATEEVIGKASKATPQDEPVLGTSTDVFVRARKYWSCESPSPLLLCA